MKKAILFLLFCLIASCKKETIETTEQDLHKTLITLSVSTDVKIDSIFMCDGEQRNWIKQAYKPLLSFTFKKGVPNDYLIIVNSNGKNYIADAWLNNGNPEITAHFKNEQLTIDKVENSPLYYEYFDFVESLEAIDKCRTKEDSLKVNKMLLSKFDAHFNDPFSNLVSENYINFNANDKKALKAFLSKLETQNDEVKNGSMQPYHNLSKLLEVKKVDISKYLFVNNGGAEQKLTLQKDKLYLLDFWFVKCVPCVRDHKIINKRLKDLEAKNVELMGISVDNPYEKWHEYLSYHHYPWINYKQTGNIDERLTTHLGIDGYPTYIVINGNGDIVSDRYHSIETFLKNYKKR